MNEKLVKVLNNEFENNLNSHVFLIETDNVTMCEKDIKQVISNNLNLDEIEIDQLNNGNFLDQITIKSDDKEITKDDILLLQKRLNLTPTLSNKIFYIIEEAEKLNAGASDKLLKTIEEPQSYAVGFLITSKISLIKSTIISRCEVIRIEYNLKPGNHENSKELNVIAESLIKSIETGTLLDFNLTKLDSDYIKTNGLEISKIMRDYYNKACNIFELNDFSEQTTNLIKKKNDYKSLINKASYLNKLLDLKVSNMNKDLLLEKIYLDLKGEL